MALPRRVADLATLELLLDVALQGSVSRAAAARGISQPSASAALDRLERRLGLRLFDRGPSGSRPTDEGRIVAASVRSLVEAAYELDEEFEALREHRQRRLRISASYTIAEYLLPAWLSGLRKAAPGPEVKVIVHNSADVMQEVLDGKVDVGFVEGAGLHAGLESAQIGEDELVVIVDPRHPWAGRDAPLPAGELAVTPLVMREWGSGTREIIEERLTACLTGRLPEPLIELGSTTTVKQAVMDGTGPSLLSEYSVRDELKEGRLRRVPVDGVNLRRVFRAVWPRRSPLHPAAARLVGQACRRGSDGDGHP